MRRGAAFAERFREPYWLACGLMLLASLPGRFASLGDSLWLDEAWVANSLLAPTLHETLYFDRWAQTAPPLFLAIAKAVISIAGYSEPALRIVPLLATLSSLVMLAIVLRRLFTPPAAWLGFAMVVSNYWVIKYGQQVKQYGTDLLVACLIVVVLERILRDGGRRTNYVRLGIAGCVLTFLSFTAVFWFASCVIAVSLPNPAPGGASDTHTGRLRYRRAIRLALALAACLGLNYLVFVRPNMAPNLFRNWATDFVDFGHPWASLQGLQQTFGALLIPLSAPLAKYAIWPVEAILAYGAFRAVRFSLRGDREAVTVLLTGLLPIVTAILVSAVGLYPILSYPRMLIWAVPCCVLLFSYALTPAVRGFSSLSISLSGRLLRYGVPAACLAVVILSQFVLFAFPRPAEKNRDAVEFIRSNAGGSDLVFVHGGMHEQFLYYRRLLRWNPNHVYFGNTNWPCCALDKEKRSSSPDARDFLDDVNRAAARARNHTLWLLLPSAAPGHWSSGLAPQMDALPRALSQQGCRQQYKRVLSQTLVLAFSCP
jgi:hypothetical protein